MALTFYSQDDAYIDSDYLAYIEIAPESLHYLDSFDLAEGRLLGHWVEACKQQRLTVGHFFEDTFLRSVELCTAIALLERVYYDLTGRTLAQNDPETPNNPYRKMYSVLRQAQSEGRGIIGLCD